MDSKRKKFKSPPRSELKVLFWGLISNFKSNQGQALLIITSFLGIILIFGFITVSNTIHFSKIINIIDERARAKEAAEAGLAKAIWCLNQLEGTNCGGTYGVNYVGESDVFIGNASFTTTITDAGPNIKTITSTGYYPSSTSTRAKIVLKQEAGIDTDVVNFHFGLQSGNGGLEMSNRATVHGNVYSNGNIIGANQAQIDGDVWVAKGDDVNTYINNMHVSGDAHANTILDSTIDGSSFSKKINNSTVGGNLFSGSADKVIVGGNAPSTSITNSTIKRNVYCQTYSNINVGGSIFSPITITPPDDPPPADMPISEEMINEWKADAEAGEIITGDFSKSSGPEVIMGPAKITGNLTLSNTAVIRMRGTIYVQGDVTLSNGATIYLDSSYGSFGGIIIVDGKITATNNINLNGSGAAGSNLMIITTNTADDAITISNSASGGIFYTLYGGAILKNETSIKELTANTIIMQNQAKIWYEEGLANATFTSGPGGRWVLKKGTWRIIR